MTLILHHAPDFASTILRFALEKRELPHTLSIVDIDSGALGRPDDRRVSPLGLRPAQEARPVHRRVAALDGLEPKPFTEPGT